MAALILALALGTAYCPATKFQDQREAEREPDRIDLEIVRVHSCAKRFLTSPCLSVIVKLDSGHRRLICGPKYYKPERETIEPKTVDK